MGECLGEREREREREEATLCEGENVEKVNIQRRSYPPVQRMVR